MSTPPTVSQILTELVAEAARAAGHGDVLPSIEPAVATNNPRFGDLQSNHAFRLGKAMRTNPRAVAEAVVGHLPAHPAVASVAVAGPGFVNFTLEDSWLAAHLAAQVSDPGQGIPQAGADHTVVIDYSSPNVAKRMHVGHMRSTLIGDALCRLHAAAGWRVVRDNHIGDWGTQFGKLIVAWRSWLDEAAFAADPIGELERLYVKFGGEAEVDPALADAARAETARLQAGDPENRALWQRFLAVSLSEFDGIYARLGVEFDHTHGESFYNEQLAGVVEALLEAGIAEHSDGAVVIRYGPEAGKGLRKTILVIRKNDGAFLYGTTDLATLAYRARTWTPDRVVYVTDKRQQLHFRQVFDAWRRWQAGDDEPTVELDHVWFGTLNLPSNSDRGGGVMSTRGGGTIRLLDFMNEAVRRARVMADEKSPDLSDGERTAVAEAVGLGAMRYADLSGNPQSDIRFDLDRMLSLEGNTAPYLLYTYARCRSIQRKGDVTALDPSGMALVDPLERALAVALTQYPGAVLTALGARRPNLLCDRLFEIANAFNRFYYKVPVLKAEPAVRAARLALVEASARVLQHGLTVLGIQTPARI